MKRQSGCPFKQLVRWEDGVPVHLCKYPSLREMHPKFKNEKLIKSIHQLKKPHRGPLQKGPGFPVQAYLGQGGIKQLAGLVAWG